MEKNSPYKGTVNLTSESTLYSEKRRPIVRNKDRSAAIIGEQSKCHAVNPRLS